MNVALSLKTIALTASNASLYLATCAVSNKRNYSQ